MRTGSNIQNYRKRNGQTQEAFAEQMGVSRQTVSKWESDACYPEMEKLIQMCEIFGCDLDTLVRGDAEQAMKTDSAGYDRHMNQFTRQICIGTVLTLCGVIAMMAMYGSGLPEVLSVIVLLCFVFAAAAFFIIGGIRHNDFVKKYPQIVDFYTDVQREQFQKKFPVYLIAGIAVALMGVMFLIGVYAIAENRLEQDEQLEALLMAGFLVFITVAAPLFIYAGMQKSKYDIDDYNKNNCPVKTRGQKIGGHLSGCIMLVATAVFLVWGLAFDGWGICWITYIIAPFLCAIVSTFANMTEKNEKEDE